MPMPCPQPWPVRVNSVPASAWAEPAPNPARTASRIAQRRCINNLIGINPVALDRRNGSLCCTTHFLKHMGRSHYRAVGVASITCRGVMNPIAMLPPPLRSAAEIVLTLVMAILIAYLAQAYVDKPYRVPSVRMSPTLEPGDRLIADRLSLAFRDPARGEIVVIHPPACVTGQNKD